MAAGLGFKTFTTGEVLTAADTNGYLMQGINVFASTAARDAAITSPQEGQFAFTKDTNSLWYYDGAAWVASGATGDIEGVTAGIGISGGGTSGTVTVTNSMATAIDAKGDLVAGTGADAFSRLGVGANNTVLTADSAEATGLKWATPAGGGGLTLIASGTLSSTSVVVSSIPGTYKHLMVSVYAATWDTANDTMAVTYNSVTTNYTKSIYGHNGTTAANEGQIASTCWSLNDGALDWTRTGGANHANWTIYDYTNTTGVINASGNASYVNTGGGYSKTMATLSNQATAAAITSLTLRLEGNRNMTAGSYKVYGVS